MTAKPTRYRPRLSPLHIHIGFNFFGAGNIGDDLMLAGFIDSLGAAMDRIELTCCTPFDIESQRLRFPQINWLADDARHRTAALNRADVWLGLGDTPFQIASGPWMRDHLLAQWAEVTSHALPMFYLGVGAEGGDVFNDPGFRALAVGAERIWCRDQASTRVIGSHTDASITTGADLCHAYLGRAQVPRRDRSPHAALALLLAFEQPEKWLSTESICSTIKSYGEVAWLVQDVRNFHGTEQDILQQLPEAFRKAAHIAKPDYERAPSVADLLDAWPTADVVASSRYHALCSMAWRGSKLVAIARSGKITGAAEDLGIPIVACNSLHDGIAQASRVENERLLELASAAARMVQSFCRTVGVLPTRLRGMTTINIAVVGCGSAADLLTLSPFLRELRQTWAKSVITLFVHPTIVDLARLCPHVNEVLAFDDPSHAGVAARELTYDLVFVPQNSSDGSFEIEFARRLTAVQKWGFLINGGRSNAETALTHAIPATSSKGTAEANLALLGAFAGRPLSTDVEDWPRKTTLTQWQAFVRRMRSMIWPNRTDRKRTLQIL